MPKHINMQTICCRVTVASLCCACSLKEVEKDFEDLQTDLTDLDEEIDWHRGKDKREKEDLFLETTQGFVKDTRVSFQSQEKLLGKMRNRFKTVLEYFGEESKGMSTDEFFGIFSSFLQSFQVSLGWLLVCRVIFLYLHCCCFIC